MFIQGLLATVLSTGKDCIPSSAATEGPPGVLYRIFRPVYKLIGIYALPLAQAETYEQVGRQRENLQSSSLLPVLSQLLGAPADRRAGEATVPGEQNHPRQPKLPACHLALCLPCVLPLGLCLC